MWLLQRLAVVALGALGVIALKRVGALRIQRRGTLGLAIRGVLGWNELQDEVTLYGMVEKSVYSGSDDDWVITVKPTDEYAPLLKSSDGKPHDINTTGVMECEVQPINYLHDKYGVTWDTRTDATTHHFLDPLWTSLVTIQGTWVEDRSHSDKTEIHPIAWIMMDQFPYGWEGLKLVTLYVFSETSNRWPNQVPHRLENRVAEGIVPFPRKPAGSGDAIISVMNELNMARFVQFTKEYIESDDTWEFHFHVESGLDNDHQGFYWAQIEVGFQRLDGNGC
jgi:hypothetical protein